MKKMQTHIWDKDTGKRIKVMGWKAQWVRTCKECGAKEHFVSISGGGSSTQGWFGYKLKS